MLNRPRAKSVQVAGSGITVPLTEKLDKAMVLLPLLPESLAVANATWISSFSEVVPREEISIVPTESMGLNPFAPTVEYATRSFLKRVE